MIQTAQRKPQTAMPKRSMEERTRCFSEVALGYSKNDALAEASRCLQCKVPRCVEGCPVGVDIPAFIKLVKQEKIQDALYKIREKNSLPAICGRVCPQENQCMGKCVLGAKGEPVNIGGLERFVADQETKQKRKMPKTQPRISGKVAVIGSGPAG